MITACRPSFKSLQQVIMEVRQVQLSDEPVPWVDLLPPSKKKWVDPGAGQWQRQAAPINFAAIGHQVTREV